MNKLILIADGLGIAIQIIVTGGGSIKMGGMPFGTSATSGQFPIIISFPYLLPTIAMATGKPMTTISVKFSPKTAPVVPPGMTQTTVKDYGHSVLAAITPVYVDFYEKHRDWLKATYKDDTTKWPPFFNFARMIRNFISHTAGAVAFNNPKATQVSWHHLTYAPSDNGKQVLGADIQMAELIVLLFELGDEFDRLGCPPNGLQKISRIMS